MFHVEHFEVEKIKNWCYTETQVTEKWKEGGSTNDFFLHIYPTIWQDIQYRSAGLKEYAEWSNMEQ